MSVLDAPVLKPENYEKWKNNMLLHLEAISDEMITVIKEGPIRILQSKTIYLSSDGRGEKEIELATPEKDVAGDKS